MRGLPFDFEVPVSFFEKSSEPENQQRRIGGIISTEARDRQGEVVLQKGLIFDDFLKNGWFNDNHSKETAEGVVGYPAAISLFKKGDKLPNGLVADKAGHWVEGYLLKGHEPADKIWNLGQSLKGTGRSLGYSVEGKIHRRIGPKTVFQKSAKGGQWVGSVVASATVRNVAITNCPVNDESSMEVLAKSLQMVEQAPPDDFETRLFILEKALAMGEATGINPPAGPQTGEGAGQVLAGQSLETDDDERFKGKKLRKTGGANLGKSLTDEAAIGWVLARRPNADIAAAVRFVDSIKVLKGQGRL